MTSRDIIVAIDAGTSVIKSVAFTANGEQVAVASRPNAYVRVAGGGVEQDMARTWKDTAATIRDVLAMLPGGAARIAALAVTGQGDGTWLIDAEGEPVAPAWLWLDARGARLASDFAAGPRHAVHYERTGTGISTCQQGIHLQWMLAEAPEILERAATAFHCKDWLYFRLTDIRATDPTEACFTFGNFRTRDYDDDVIANLGLASLRRLLPPIEDAATTAGAITAAASDATGLTQGTPVLLGYIDIACTGLGGGLVSETPGTGCSILGSTGVHMRLVRDLADVVLNEERSGYVCVAPVPGAVIQLQTNMAATLNIDWMLDLAKNVLALEGVARSREDLVRSLDDRVLAAQPIATLYHPYISEAGERGPFMNPLARAQFTGIHSEVSFPDLMRSVMEGLAFASRDCFSATGELPSEVRLTGGAARSRAMRQLLATILGRPLRTVDREEAGAAGAAMMAAVQQGFHPSIDACATAWTEPRLSPATLPDEAMTALYDDAFALYRDVSRSLPPVWERLDALKRRAGA